MKKIIKAIAIPTILAGLAFAGLRYISPGIFSKPQKGIVTEYALSKGLESQTAQTIGEKLGPTLEDNEKRLIEIVSSYSPNLQEVCANSDILDNGHVSKAELASTKKASLEGVVNPKERYALILNGVGPDNSSQYSQTSTELSLANALAFYKVLKSQGLDDEHIRLLISNPSEIDFYQTALHNFFEQGNRLSTIQDGKKTSSVVSPLKLLPTPKDKIEIDGESTRENFSESKNHLHPDHNDDIYFGIFAPEGEISELEKRTKMDRPYVKLFGEEPTNKSLFKEFEGITYLNLGNFIRNLEYDKAFIFLGSYQSLGLIDRLGWQGEVKNTLAIASPNTYGFANEIFPVEFLDKQLSDRTRSVESIVEEMNALYQGTKFQPNVFYFNENGTKKPVEECSWFREPFL